MKTPANFPHKVFQLNVSDDFQLNVYASKPTEIGLLNH